MTRIIDRSHHYWDKISRVRYLRLQNQVGKKLQQHPLYAKEVEEMVSLPTINAVYGQVVSFRLFDQVETSYNTGQTGNKNKFDPGARPFKSLIAKKSKSLNPEDEPELLEPKKLDEKQYKLPQISRPSAVRK